MNDIRNVITRPEEIKNSNNEKYSVEAKFSLFGRKFHWKTTDKILVGLTVFAYVLGLSVGTVELVKDLLVLIF